MKIFDDNYYNNPNVNAYLNWRTDAPEFSSLFAVGAGFLGSSLILLQSIINDGNFASEADKYIFPIMFNLWHGIELMLKSGIILIRTISGQSKVNDLIDHKIIVLYKLFEEELNTYGLTKPQDRLKSLKELLNEFASENVHFDAFRYPYDKDWQEQFYNICQANGIVENKCINLLNLQIKICEIIDSLPGTIKYFEDNIISDGQDISYICDDTYENYMQDDFIKEYDYDTKEDPIKILMKKLNIIM